MSTIPNERRIWRQRMRDAAMRWRKYRHADLEEALAAIVAACYFRSRSNYTHDKKLRNSVRFRS